MYLKVQLSYAADEKEALGGAYDQWRSNIFPSAVLSDLRTAEQLEQTAMFVREEDLRDHVRISSDPARHLEWLQQDIDLGFSQLILHNVNLQQERFIEVFGEKVVPQLLS
jgi:coenzyme F420-dependent glucose-6-phosphate dehydrogenase